MINARLPRPLPPEELDEAAQNALGSIWLKLPRYTGDTRLEAWAFGFCRVELMNAVRQRTRSTRMLALPEIPAPTRESLPDEYDRVERALASIDRRRADVIRLKHFSDLKFDEIARRESVPTNTAKTLYYRGVQDIQALLRTTPAREIA
ncbi:MAG: sigma-70 family RNA polymerase sigma factor [Planctomycetes bacterium]|nr:sigma-70 family RNA polymerase sigma factor [Planctomycetota bacterium]MCC7169215.1 sigma-70 family RNA polymerase sigma factor [Planctomycetota bacterium]